MKSNIKTGLADKLQDEEDNPIKRMRKRKRRRQKPFLNLIQDDIALMFAMIAILSGALLIVIKVKKIEIREKC